MVKGLDIFRQYFRDYSEYYLLIGGTACDLAFRNAGIEFRMTRDLDIVLCIDNLNREFIQTFWKFIRDGNYRHQSTARRQYYRFQKPGTQNFPEMLELFSRKPEMFSSIDAGVLTPIPTDDDLSSLSAILLNDSYYQFLIEGRTERQGLAFVGPEHLVPLKAKAWLDLGNRRAQGKTVDSKVIRKHRNDVLRLYRILDPVSSIILSSDLRNDMLDFVTRMKNESIDMRSMDLGGTDIDSILNEIRRIYNLG